MGLDYVEIVIEVEEKFGISIDDDEAASTLTVGQLADLIARKTSTKTIASCPTAKAFYRLRNGMNLALGISRRNARPTTSTEAMLPYWGRNRVWKRLEQSIGLRLPPMENQAGVCIFWFLAAAVPLSFLLGCAMWRDPFAAAAFSLMSLLPGVLFGYIAGILFLPHTPLPQHRTLGGLAKGLIAYNYDQFVPSSMKTPEDEEIWNKLCDILVKQLGAKRERLHRETEIVGL